MLQLSVLLDALITKEVTRVSGHVMEQNVLEIIPTVNLTQQQVLSVTVNQDMFTMIVEVGKREMLVTYLASTWTSVKDSMLMAIR